MGDLGFQVGGQVDDVNGAKGAFLGADTATNAQSFGDVGDFRVRGDLDAKLARADHGARLLTLLATFLFSLLAPCLWVAALAIWAYLGFALWWAVDISHGPCWDAKKLSRG